MFAPGSFSGSALFIAIRFLPLLASVSVGAIPTDDPEALTTSIHLLLMVTVITGVWYMIEGLGMVWLRAREANHPKSRGYGFVAIVGTVCLCALLPLFRAYSSQGLFLLLLVTLSLRGMARSGWERGRPQVALVCSFFGAGALALLSFFVVSPDLYWQRFVVAATYGCGVATCEASWFAEGLRMAPVPRWFGSAFRVALFLGPLLLGTLGLFHQLPRTSILLLMVLPLASKINERITQQNGLQPNHFPLIAGYLVLTLGCLAGSVYY